MNARPFLTARWENLAILSWGVDDALLVPHLPTGLEFDRREGRAHVSLVAFDFADTRVLGIHWPGHVNFPEINLRFYVSHPATARRGVCFIREFVPRRLVAAIARWVYNEPYAVARMTSRVQQQDSVRSVAHDWTFRSAVHSIRVEARNEPGTPASDSAEHWFKEHEWGFGRDRRGRAITYRVEHPVWQVYPVTAARVDADLGALYGSQWADLSKRPPDSVVLAVGSAVRVFPRSS